MIRLGSGWEPQRFWFVGGALDFGERRSNTLGRDYDYFAAMINVRYAFDF